LQRQSSLTSFLAADSIFLSVRLLPASFKPRGCKFGAGAPSWHREVVIELRRKTKEGRSLVESNLRTGATTAEERMQFVEEHVQAEVDHDLDAIMRTWGGTLWVDSRRRARKWQ